MEKMTRIETISEYNAIFHHETLHPLVSVIDVSKAAVAPPEEYGKY